MMLFNIILQINNKKYKDLPHIPRMNIYQGKRISELLKLCNTNKGGMISKPILTSLQKLLTGNQMKIYPFEILHIYNYLVQQHVDKASFNFIDNLIFPVNNNPKFQLSLLLIYSRLYCLFKYNGNFGEWTFDFSSISKLRHSVNDFKVFFRSGNLETVRHCLKFNQLYSQVIDIFLKNTIDSPTLNLIAMIRLLNNQKMLSNSLNKLIKLTQSQIQKDYTVLTYSQYLFLSHCRHKNVKWIFQCFMPTKNFDAKTLAYMTLYNKINCPWKKYIQQKFTMQEVYQKLPIIYIYPPREHRILQYLMNNAAIKKPYFDYFMRFKTQSLRKKIKLAKPNKQYTLFITNLITFLQSNDNILDKSLYYKCQSVLSETSALKCNQISPLIYFSAIQSLLYYCQIDKQTKINKQVHLVKQTVKIYNKHQNLTQMSVLLQNHMLPTQSFKSIGALEFDVYRMPQFIKFYEKMMQNYKQVSTNILKSRKLAQSISIQRVVLSYMLLQRPSENILIGNSVSNYNYKSPIDPENELIIQIHRDVNINKKLNVDYWIKIKNVRNKRQVQFLLDFQKRQLQQEQEDTQGKMKDKKILPLKFYWKYRYIVDWCHLNYQTQTFMTFQEYFKTSKFQSYCKKVQDIEDVAKKQQ